jgi:hypothetical protein
MNSGGRGPGERVLHGTGGVGGAARKTVVRRSTLKEAGAELRREAKVGRATLTMESRLAEKQDKERILAHLKSQRMRDPSYWCVAGVDDDVEEGMGETAAEVDGSGGDEAASNGGLHRDIAPSMGADDTQERALPSQLSASEQRAADMKLIAAAVAHEDKIVVVSGVVHASEAATRSGRAHY